MPTAERSSSASVNSLLEEELRILLQLVLGRWRHRTYRHHLFMQDAVRVFRCVRRVLSSSVVVSSGAAVAAVQRVVVRLGESCVNETRANRIDTLPLVLALLACAARLHRLLQELQKEIDGWSDPPVVTRKHAQRRCLSCCQGASDADEVGAAGSGTIGATLDAAKCIGTAGSRSKPPHSGKKRQRT